MHVCSSWRCVGSSALQIESVVWRARLTGQPAMSRQLWICSLPRRHDCRSFLCFAARKAQTESSCHVFSESSSCARARAACSAAGGLQWYSCTRHSVVAFSSSEIELHSTTSPRRVLFLLHAPAATRQENTTSCTSWDFMAPNIANGALAEQQEHVVKCVSPRSYTESAQQVETAEKQARDGAKDEGINVERVAERADVVEGRENQRAQHCRGDAGHEGAPSEQPFRTPREQSDE